MANEVQANSVIYSRKDYIMVLDSARSAFETLAKLRATQIDAWKGDIDAREADLSRLLMHRYTHSDRHKYSSYLESLKTPTKRSWWNKILGRHPGDKVDEYGSLEAYVAETTGKTFEQYKAGEIERVSSHTKGDLIAILRWFSSNSDRFVDNEWEDRMDIVSQMLAEVEYGNCDAQFVIPREAFDSYASAMILADSGKIAEVVGTLYNDYMW